MALLTREEAAIQAAWIWFRRNRDVDVPFSAIVALVRARCPGVDPMRIQAGFERRRLKRTRVR